MLTCILTGHCSVDFQDYVVVIGGFYLNSINENAGFTNNISIFDRKTNMWSEISPDTSDMKFFKPRYGTINYIYTTSID